MNSYVKPLGTKRSNFISKEKYAPDYAVDNGMGKKNVTFLDENVFVRPENQVHDNEVEIVEQELSQHSNIESRSKTDNFISDASCTMNYDKTNISELHRLIKKSTEKLAESERESEKNWQTRERSQ